MYVSRKSEKMSQFFKQFFFVYLLIRFIENLSINISGNMLNINRFRFG